MEVVLVLILGLFHTFVLHLLTGTPEFPKFEETRWDDGKRCNRDDDSKIHPFRVSVSQQDIEDIHLRLNISRPSMPPLQDTQHRYGLNPLLLRDILGIIRTQYNFTERQEFLNQYPQFTTKIQGLIVHFLHVKPRNPANLPVYPLLLLHGWPSSVREFYEMIPTLTTEVNRSFLFELVIPSLVALVFWLLMRRLYHETFYVHGSDWGALVATDMATLYPDSVLGLHSNFCFSLRYISLVKIALGSWFPSLFVKEVEFRDKLYPLSSLARFYLAESGYLHIQGTKPDTIGMALDNSLEGLLAFILEKVSVGSNKHNIHLPGAGLDKFSLTALLDTILFYYWLPKTATTAARFYAENLNIKAFKEGLHNIPMNKKVPCGCVFFEYEFLYQPKSILTDKFVNLVHYTTYKSVGHFAALERSDILVEDIASFVSKTIT
ncbi:hypothetical protein NQ315_001372 [Exocentrus adspersus]|uniref:Epoxide hydrolase n=1 Tax=Exocentrus adspersus TaxID=1586481 RepID=A0AAV8WFF8_9CUCU|nr:hypothetical protein NQ315_001372 [Exocentrus adspersus]